MRILEGKRSAWFLAANLFAALTACSGEQDRNAAEALVQERIRQSPHWRDGRFRNQQELWIDNLKAMRSLFSRSEFNSPKAPVPVASDTLERLSVAPASGLRATWFGHSSTLLEVDGLKLLLDPVWGERSSPVSFVGPKRWYAPVVPLEKLPVLDAVLISHDHYDHLDRGTIRALKDRVPRFIVPLGVGRRLRDWGVEASRITELDWWEKTHLGELVIQATPARHAGGRGLLDRDKSLWCGYALLGPRHKVYYSGDSGMMDAFRTIGERCGPFDLTLIEIGEYSQDWPDWHMGPEQAVQAHRMVGGKVMLPVHWGLFSLSTHSWTEPIERASVAALHAGVPLATPRPGEVFEPEADQLPITAWWPALPWRSAHDYPIVSTKDGKAVSH
jgi:L-ascorbate metabolism protein UlaG (beta-lactamase superfamily)